MLRPACDGLAAGGVRIRDPRPVPGRALPPDAGRYASTPGVVSVAGRMAGYEGYRIVQGFNTRRQDERR